MARTKSLTSTNAESTLPATPITDRVTRSRVQRSVSAATTRQRSRMLAESSSNGVLQTMVDEAEAMAGGSRPRYTGKGKGKAVRAEADTLTKEADEAATGTTEDVCPITDKDTKPFRIMDLPAEIRLEIYRACLTRPYNILLSKREQPPPPTTADITLSDDQIELGDSSDDDVFGPVIGPVSGPQGPQLELVNSPPRRDVAGGGSRTNAPRSSRRIRFLSTRSVPATSSPAPAPMFDLGPQSSMPPTSVNFVSRPSTSRTGRRTAIEARNRHSAMPEPERPQSQDPLIVNILCVSKEIYKEARSVLYSENLFTLDLNTAMTTLGCLHQRSRRLIKHVELEIPTYNEILERFQETVRLSLRYCLGLKKFIIHMPFTLPGADGSGTTGNTTVYANGFDILRWLPQQCEIAMKGNICSEIEIVVNKHKQLAKALDKVSYAKAQLWPHISKLVITKQMLGF